MFNMKKRYRNKIIIVINNTNGNKNKYDTRVFSWKSKYIR